jgi:formylglycine-generating enzyme required for sulfatase activity
LYDTLGNVLEWTLTASSPYRIRRGGSWFNSASDCTTVNRFSYYPDIRHDNAGFRLFAPAGLQ